jgi:hypothetical protein
MSALIEGRSLEAEIAECCQAMYRATDPEVALRNWARLRQLTALKSEEDLKQFLRETKNRDSGGALQGGSRSG